MSTLCANTSNFKIQNYKKREVYKMSSNIISKLLTCSAITTITVFSSFAVQAADRSAEIEAGGTVNIDGADTFIIDNTNDGFPNLPSIVFTDDNTNGVDSLTVSSDGLDAQNATDTGSLGDITVLDDNGTNTLTLQGSSNGDDLQLRIEGDINGNVATDANDLRIVVDGLANNAASTSTLVLEQSTDLGSGNVTLTGDADDFGRLVLEHSVNETFTGNILSTTDNVGSIVWISSVGGALTINGDVGQDGAGIQTFLIGDQTGQAGNVIINGNVDANTIDIDANSGTTVADFNGNVTGGTINIEGGPAAGSDVSFAGDVTVSSIVLDFETGGVNVTFDGSSAQSVTGTIMGAQDGEGSIFVATGADVTFNSVIGTGVNDLDNLNIQSGATARFKQNVGVEQDAPTDLAINVDGTIVFDTSDNNVTIFSIGDIDIDGTVNAIGANNARISSNNDLFIDGTLSTALTGASRTLTLDGPDSIVIGVDTDTTIMAGNQIVTTNDFTLGGGATNTTLNIRRTADFDPRTTTIVDATGDMVTIGGDLEVGIDASSLNFSVGDTVTVIGSDTNAAISYATLINTGVITFRDTAVLNLEDNGSDAQNLRFITLVQDTIAGANENEENAIQQAAIATSGGNDPEAFAAISGLNASQTQNAGQQLQGDLSGGAATTEATASNMMSGFDMVSARMSDLRRGSGDTGLSSGDGYSDGYIWARAFGGVADQDNRDSAQGYDADTVGLMIGADKLLEGNIRFGLNASYSQTDVDTNGAGNHNAEIDTYRVGAYGGVNYARYYVEGQVSAAYNDINTSREITFGALDRNVTGDTDGYEIGARVGAGMPIALGNGQWITPNTNFQYIHASVDDFTETGGGALNTNIDNDDINIAELGIGAKYNAEFETQNGMLVPELSAGIAYDFIGDTAVSNQQFTGGGSTFRVEGGDVEQFSVNYGAGIAWTNNADTMEVSVNYNGKAKSDYTSHGGRIEAKLRF